MTLPYLPTTGCPAPDLRRPLAELPVAGAESGRYAPSPSREPRDRVRTRRPGRVTPGGGGRVPPGSCLPARPVALRTLCAGAGRARPRPDGPQNVDQASASRLRKVRPGSIRQATRDITWRNGVPAPVLRARRRPPGRRARRRRPRSRRSRRGPRRPRLRCPRRRRAPRPRPPRARRPVRASPQ